MSARPRASKSDISAAHEAIADAVMALGAIEALVYEADCDDAERRGSLTIAVANLARFHGAELDAAYSVLTGDPGIGLSDLPLLQRRVAK
jgi:hypothetical protein